MEIRHVVPETLERTETEDLFAHFDVLLRERNIAERDRFNRLRSENISAPRLVQLMLTWMELEPRITWLRLAEEIFCWPST